MQKGCKGLAAHLGIVLVLSVSVFWGTNAVMAAPISHDCTFEAPGDGCVFDLTATGKSTLKVDTQAGTPGDLWRVCVVQGDVASAVCKIGTGSATSFTGLIQKGLLAGKTYEVFVIYEAPLPDPFPATSVQVRFYGAAVDQNRVTIDGPRPQGSGPPAGPPVPAARTGQTTSFAIGDDGDIQAGVPSPTPRFTDNLNGTVTDHLTGLIWLKNADCFLCGRGLPWANAVGEANSLASGSCGLTDGSAPGDWRLPNVKELLSLIDYGQVYPALAAGHPFVNVRVSTYWSSTTRPDNQNLAWYVELASGQSAVVDKISQASPLCVWPVRGGD